MTAVQDIQRKWVTVLISVFTKSTYSQQALKHVLIFKATTLQAMPYCKTVNCNGK